MMEISFTSNDNIWSIDLHILNTKKQMKYKTNTFINKYNT